MHTEVDFHSAVYTARDTGISEIFDAALLRVGKPAREMNKADRLRVIEYLKNMDAFSYRRGGALCGRPPGGVPVHGVQVPGRGERPPAGPKRRPEMEHQHAIETYFAQREEQLVEAVSRLVRIDSTLGPAQPASPSAPAPPPPWRSCSAWPGNGAWPGRTSPAISERWT